MPNKWFEELYRLSYYGNTLYKLRAVQARMCSTTEDVQYKQGTSLVRERMCSMSQAYLQ